MNEQIIWLFFLAMPVASIAWTITHEEIFKEPREFCVSKSENATSIFKKKFFYLFTCEYCFSHYVTAFFIYFTDFKFLLTDWRGYVIAGFSLVWIANIYMNIFAFLRQRIKKEKTVIKEIEEKIDTDN